MSWVEELRSGLNGAFRHLELDVRSGVPAVFRGKPKSDEEIQKLAEPFVSVITKAIVAHVEESIDLINAHRSG